MHVKQEVKQNRFLYRFCRTSFLHADCIVYSPLIFAYHKCPLAVTQFVFPDRRCAGETIFSAWKKASFRKLWCTHIFSYYSSAQWLLFPFPILQFRMSFQYLSFLLYFLILYLLFEVVLVLSNLLQWTRFYFLLLLHVQIL